MRTVWAILRLRHPLLASKVVMQDYEDISFVYVPMFNFKPMASTHISFRYTPRGSVDDVLQDADDNLEYRSASKDG